MSRTTGSGIFTFRHRPIEVPDRVAEHMAGAHGAFIKDAADGDGSTWFGLKNVGLLRLDPDLTRIEVVGGDPRLVAANIHGGCVVRHGGTTYLGLPSNEAQAVWLTDTSGNVVRTFENPYGQTDAPFNVCDVEIVDGLMYAANGYADDVCFTSDPFRSAPDDPSKGIWDAARFGGKGAEHGRFATAHGVTRVPGTNVFTIADRRNARLETYAPGGRYVAGLTFPPGTMPCNVDYYDRFALVACLRGPGESTPAPIYLYEDGNLVSEINIGRDLGLERFTHVHNAVFRVLEGRDGSRTFNILAYAWNPGDFAILEQVS
jgi:hypothetical protein